MKKELFKEKWPRLYKAITLIGADNGMSLRPDIIMYDLNDLERIAGLLSDENLDVVCTGDQDESEGILEVISGQELNDFLNEVFEGTWSDLFYKP